VTNVVSEHQAWLTRIAIYLGVWAAADIAAVLVRFGDIASLFSMPMWLVASVQSMSLLVFVRRDGARSEARGLALAVIVANVGIAALSFWTNAPFSRSWLVMTIVFALVGLLTTSAVLRRTVLRRA
jgi:hypothetical protein